MSFNFSLSDFQDESSWVRAVSEGHKNSVGPTKTSQSQDPTPRAGLTTYTVSDIMQGMTFYKPKGATLDLFNQNLSSELQGLKSEKLYKEDKVLSPYDIGTDPSKPTTIPDPSLAIQTQVTNSPGTVSPGSPPSNIPKGPFPLRIIRKGYTAVHSDVAPVTLTIDQVARLLLSVGCPEGEPLVNLVAIPQRESGYVTNVAGIDPNGGMGVGIWQITEFYPTADGKTAESMTDPWTNAQAMMVRSRNGTFFAPWNLPVNGQPNQWTVDNGSWKQGVDIEGTRKTLRGLGYHV